MRFTPLLVLLLLPAPAAAAGGKGLTFHPVTIAQINADACDHWTKLATHLEVDGWVFKSVPEQDGDRHVGVCDDQKLAARLAKEGGFDHLHCMVWEIISAVPLKIPRIGDHVRGQGIERYDAEDPGHHWFELHPLLHWEIIK